MSKKKSARVAEILNKIESVSVPKVKKVAIAYSGGLDSSLCVVLAREKYGASGVLAINIDVGQGAEEMNEAREKAKVLGIEPIVVDAKEEFTKQWLPKAIRANSDYMGYPVSTSMTRQLIARRVALMGKEQGCDALMEGSSGKGNDQYRMHNVFKLFAPELEILVPVRDFDLTRDEEKELCAYYGIPVTEALAGGDDKTMWCRSIASGAIGLDQELPDDIWMWYRPPEKAPDRKVAAEIEFDEGVPVSLNGRRAPLEKIIYELNAVGGAHAIGRIDMFEHGIMSLISREIYEAPAATIILKLHRDLEQWCLTKEEIEFKRIVDQKWGHVVYHGEWFHPLRAELDSFIAESQGVVNGSYKIELYRGNIAIVRRRSDSGLFSPEIRSIRSKSFNQQMCAHAARIRGLPFEILAKRAGRSSGN